MKTKKITAAFIIIMAATLFAGCSKKITATVGVEEDTQFGSIYLGPTIDDFNKLGFEYGDSLNFALSNGVKLEDVPYYNGYYGKDGELLLCAYPGYPHPSLCENNGNPLWELYKMKETDTITVTLNKKAKYIDRQETMNIVYSDNAADFANDIVFGNFRALTGGNLKENIFYRGASPCQNEHNRANNCDNLCKNAGIDFMLNLSDNSDEIALAMAADDFNSPYFTHLLKNGKVALCDLTSNFNADKFCTSITNGFRRLIASEGPYYMHCIEGKDRTGFAAVLVESLAGATKDEMQKDYMITYDNYYGITKASDPTKYDILVSFRLMPMFECLESFDETGSKNLTEGAKGYLRHGGMDDSEINLLIERITK